MVGPHDHAPRGGADAEPTQDQLLAMAYADGELSGPERAAFEARLGREPALAREVAGHRALEVLARRLAPAEPADHEWRRLASEPLQRSAQMLGWAGFVLGLIGLAGLALWHLFVDDVLGPVERGLVAVALIGALLLFLSALRGRLRTYSLDPYRNVDR